jgi:hypothetical protein
MRSEKTFIQLPLFFIFARLWTDTLTTTVDAEKVDAEKKGSPLKWLHLACLQS